MGGLLLAVKYRAISELKPYDRNARTHTDEQVGQVMASIKEFGWTNPVLIDDTGGIIAGHARVEAAKRMGADKVPTIQLSRLSEAQKRAYILADNKLALNAGWDEALLAIELSDLKDIDYNLTLTGFDIAEINGLLTTAASPGDNTEEIVPDSDPNIVVRLSFSPAVWLGKRDEVNDILAKLEKKYLCMVKVDE